MRKWTEQEIAYLKKNYQTMETRQMAKNLDRDFTTTKRAVKKYIYDLNMVCLPQGFVVITSSPIHAINQVGQVISIKTRKLIKPSPNSKGYLQVCLQGKKTHSIHRLVAITFIPNPENLPQINHIDGDKLNNHVSNLEWVTNSQNMAHGIKLGLFDEMPKKLKKHQTGETNSAAKLKETDVLKIYQLLKKGMGVCELARMYGVGHSQISYIKAGKSWRHIYHNFLERSKTSESVGSSDSKQGASQVDDDIV